MSWKPQATFLRKLLILMVPKQPESTYVNVFLKIKEIYSDDGSNIDDGIDSESFAC